MSGRLRKFGLSLCIGCCTLVFSAPAPAADLVTRATDLADQYGEGLANWRTLAIMHRAMHDAANAATPTYERWAAPTADEPAANGASAQSAMVAAAARVLTLLHPARSEETARALKRAFLYIGDEPGRAASIALGNAIGTAAVERRANDGSSSIRPFVGASGLGVWARTPLGFETSNTSSAQPYLFPDRPSYAAPPPPPVDSDLYRRDLEEARRIGAVETKDRTADQGASAIFWAGQSSQRGYMHLAIRLLEEHPRAGGVIEHARIMSQMATAMADSAILVWLEKERYAFWRPVTAIRAGSAGVAPDPNWLPLIDTPPFPEYPSGHAADCFTGSATLRAAFGSDVGALVYMSLTGKEKNLSDLSKGVGQHDQSDDGLWTYQRRFPSLEAAATDCAESRLFAGAHFRFSDVEAKRVGDQIAARAAESVPRLDRRPRRD
ncbi:MAG: vanadium-dependent haloperoxidase [Burkholderiales bacterium]